jgi:uncharacterized protein
MKTRVLKVRRAGYGNTMLDTTKISCDGCAACCLQVGHPPFLLELDNDIPRAIEGADSLADYKRLCAAPSEARDAYFATIEAADGPCPWLDVDARRCRHYEYRPDICRSFEVGAKWCAQLRGLERIE